MVLSLPNIGARATMHDKTPNLSIQSGRAGSVVPLGTPKWPTGDLEH